MVARGAIGYIPVYPCISLFIPVVSPMAAREGYSVYPFTSLFIPYIRLRPYIPVYRQGEPHGGQGGYPIYPCISPYLRIPPYILMYPVYPLEPAYPQISPYIPRVCPMAARGGVATLWPRRRGFATMWPHGGYLVDPRIPAYPRLFRVSTAEPVYPCISLGWAPW